jgi:hypothetical protein
MAGTITVEGKFVVFRPHGLDRVWALKNELKIPLSHVKGVSTERQNWMVLKQLKMGGTGLPWVIKAGRWWGREGFLFYDMHNLNDCVTVSTKDEFYTKIIFEVEDKEAVAKMIKKASLKKRGSHAKKRR